jgi:pyridoxamine 5'-phosphate oxidase
MSAQEQAVDDTMNFDECMLFAKDHPICAFTTVDGDQPRVRMLGMWFADEKGFYFWTTKIKEVYRQLRENAKVELCFYAPPAGALVSFLHTKQLYAIRDGPLGEGGTIDLGKSMRASGNVVFLDDPKLKDRLLEERPFLRPVAEDMVFFRVEKGEAWFWTFADSGRESVIERITF